ncbi:MAG: hypothetical protein AAFX96_06315, partial [Pseudomonadota bacterium]
SLVHNQEGQSRLLFQQRNGRPNLITNNGCQALSSFIKDKKFRIGHQRPTNCKLLVLDEATEGLAPVVRNEIWAAVTLLKQQSGLSLLIVDKTLKEITKLADRCTIVEKGATVWHGTPGELTLEISDRYLGV